MTTPSTQNHSKLVALASIAAELHSVLSVAWSVSLAAKNAKVISAQSGNSALGFHPITEFIDEVAQVAMQGVNDINNEALCLTKIAVANQRNVNAYQRFNAVRKKHTNARHINSMSPAMNRIEQNMQCSKQKFKQGLTQLTQFLETMDECMLSARAIASVSRIVTSNAKEYSNKLKVVADDLDKAARYIKEKIADSYTHLEIIYSDMRKQT